LVNDHSYMYKISKQYIHKKYRRDLITKESDFTLYKKLNSNIDLSDDLKKFILQNVKKETYDSSEDDSLFEIISKTYKRNAYSKLLEEEPEKP